MHLNNRGSTQDNTRDMRRMLTWSNMLEYQKRREKGYVAFEDAMVPADGTLNLHLENTSNDKSIVVISFLISSQFMGRWAVYDSFDSVSGGTEVTVDNLLMDEGGEPDTGDMNVLSNVDYTNAEEHYAGTIPSGGNPSNSVGGSITTTEPIIEPNREVVIEIENESNTERRGSIGLVYTTTDVLYSEYDIVTEGP